MHDRKARKCSRQAGSLEGESMGPALLLQIHQHALLQLILPVRDRDAVVVPVQAMDQRLQHHSNRVKLHSQQASAGFMSE